MATRNTGTDRLLGPEGVELRDYRCETCHSSFSCRDAPDVATCPRCGAYRVREL